MHWWSARESFSVEKIVIKVAHFDTPSEKAELAPIPKTICEESRPPWDTQHSRYWKRKEKLKLVARKIRQLSPTSGKTSLIFHVLNPTLWFYLGKQRQNKKKTTQPNTGHSYERYSRSSEETQQTRRFKETSSIPMCYSLDVTQQQPPLLPSPAAAPAMPHLYSEQHSCIFSWQLRPDMAAEPCHLPGISQARLSSP